MGQRRPRRRRARPSSRSIPALAAAVGVIVVGFGIGAVIAGFSHRTPSSQHSEPPAPSHTMVSRVTPVPVTPAPVLTPRHTSHPRVSPRASATPHHSPSPSPSPSSQGSSQPSPPPTAPPTNSPVVVATRTPAPMPRVTSSVPPATAQPSASAASAVPAHSPSAGTPVTRDAAALVRRYLAAIMRGDEPAAFAALGGAPGDKGLNLSEEAFLDPKARILSLRTRARGEASATVEVEIASSKGTYFATYRVAPGNQGPVIESHDFIKP